MDASVICIGELVVDFIGRKRFLGGGPAHVAIHLHQCGTATRLYSCLGKDHEGTYLFDQLQRMGLDTKGVQWTEKVPTRHLVIHVLPDGDFSLTIPEKHTAEQYLQWNDEMEADLYAAKLLHIGGTAFLGDATRKTTRALIDKALSTGTRLSFDPNIRLHSLSKPAHEAIMECITIADYLKLNEREWGQVFGDSKIQAIALQKKQLLVRTLGGHGAELAFGECYHFEPPPACPVTNTLGAGDAFWSGVLSGLLKMGLMDKGSLDKHDLAKLGTLGSSRTKNVLGSPGGVAA